MAVKKTKVRKARGVMNWHRKCWTNQGKNVKRSVKNENNTFRLESSDYASHLYKKRDFKESGNNQGISLLSDQVKQNK